jgi:hypothetical protein
VVGAVPREQAVVPGGQAVAFDADGDAGGRDVVAASVAAAVSNTEARYHELASDTYGAGSQIGDLMSLPQVPTGPGVGLADVDLPARGLGY